MCKLTSSLGGFTPVIDETGKITGYTTTIGGADTVFPFISKPIVSNEVTKSFVGSASSTVIFNASDFGLTEIYGIYSSKQNKYRNISTQFTVTKSQIICVFNDTGSGEGYNGTISISAVGI